MKDINDEDLQKMIEKTLKGGIPVEGDQDVRAYSMLFNVLGKQPATSLPYNFSSKVTASLIAKKSRTSEIRLYLVIGLALVVLAISTFLYLSTISVAPTYQLTLVLSKYKWVGVFGIITVFIIQFLDQKFIRKNFKL